MCTHRRAEEGDRKKPARTQVSAWGKTQLSKTQHGPQGLPRKAVSLRRIGKPFGKKVVERFLRRLYPSGHFPRDSEIP